MASVTASTATDDRPPGLSWSGRWTLAYRILAVNILAVVLLALSVVYLDSYRKQLSDERIRQAAQEARLIASSLAAVSPQDREAMLIGLANSSESRFRLYDSRGQLEADSWQVIGPTYELRDPAAQRWTKDVARALDRGFNLLVSARPIEDFEEPQIDRLQAWPEAVRAQSSNSVQTEVREAPDLTPVWSAAAPAGESTLLLTANDRNFTRTIRGQRAALGLAVLLSTLLSVLLSLFLARTIVRPLRRLAVAAHRVRLGRAREVKVPRHPKREDEIGLLARAVSDMSQSLRQRIDNIEAFASDVTHELKNPLASLRSAVESIETVEDSKVRKQLTEIVRGDIARLDRLISDISEAARTDAELARANFEPVDLGPLIEQLVAGWEQRREKGNARIAFARPRKSTAVVIGEPGRLARALDNIIDNAISFSPAGGLVEIAAVRVGDHVLVRVDDEGPGVPPEAREAIFNRFHSIRPEGEEFGRHSGLGLAIAKAIVQGHDGEIDVQDRDDAPSGARFIIRLPAAEPQPQ